MADFTPWAVAALPQIIVALLLLLAGIFLARWSERAVVGFLQRHRGLDLTFRGLIVALVRYSILLLAVLAAMQQVGIQTTSVLAAIGAVLVAIGLALQGTLSNLAAGLMLLWLRPFRVGDTIETASVAGTVTDVGLFATEISRGDGVYVFVPNNDLWNKPVSNLSRMPRRMIELRFAAKKGEDLDAVRESLLAVASANPAVHKDPAPAVGIAGVADGGLTLALTAWVDTAEFQRVAGELAQRASERWPEAS